MNNGQPVLVTGAHRTGTTWVGKMLAASNGTAYISEPLNVLHRPGVLRVPTRHWYTYVTDDNQAHYLPAFRETLSFRYHLLSELGSLRSRKDVLRMGRDASIFLRGRLGRRRAVIKDPFAIFSIPWFHDRLDCQVVVTVRHPAAFASSLKRLDWPFQIEDLLAQPLLMRDWLEPYRSEMKALLKTPEDVIGQSSLLWCMIYTTVKQLQQRYPDLVVVRHEDLSLNPVGGFRELYEALSLPFTPVVEEIILYSSSSENPGEISKKNVHSVRLDSQANLHNWKRRLEPVEIERVRRLTGEVAEHYYPEIDWD